MSYPVAAGVRNIGSDTMRYIPTIYSSKIIQKYYDRTVLSRVTNTDYEGEIKKFGDTIIIRQDPTITIRDYRKGQTLVNEQPEATSLTMLIDQGKYWSFVAEDLDKKQTDIKAFTDRWATDAAKQLQIVIDTAVLAAMPAGASAYNSGATAGYTSASFDLGTGAAPRALTKANVLEVLVDCATCLDELNVPEEGRYFIITPAIAGLIEKSDLKDASLTGDPKSVIRTRSLGMIAGFDLYQSNLLPTIAGGGGGKGCSFGIKYATSFATQLTELKMIDNPFGFGTLHRGLQVYGYKVTKPEGLGYLTATVG